MTKHFHRELGKIKKMILSLGALVEERVRMAIQAIEDRDADLAARIINLDYEIDEMEVEVEEECLKVLALYQPVAVDLRFLVDVIKINNDLERVGDEAVNIAERVVILAKHEPSGPFVDYSVMSDKAEDMLKKSLDALINLDTDLAFRVLILDDEVDKINKENYDKVKHLIADNPGQMGYLINLMLISRHLERLADHATNIAEETIYMVEGEIVRHGNY